MAVLTLRCLTGETLSRLLIYVREIAETETICKIIWFPRNARSRKRDDVISHKRYVYRNLKEISLEVQIVLLNRPDLLQQTLDKLKLLC